MWISWQFCSKCKMPVRLPLLLLFVLQWWSKYNNQGQKFWCNWQLNHFTGVKRKHKRKSSDAMRSKLFSVLILFSLHAKSCWGYFSFLPLWCCKCFKFTFLQIYSRCDTSCAVTEQQRHLRLPISGCRAEEKRHVLGMTRPASVCVCDLRRVAVMRQCLWICVRKLRAWSRCERGAVLLWRVSSDVPIKELGPRETGGSLMFPNCWNSFSSSGHCPLGSLWSLPPALTFSRLPRQGLFHCSFMVLKPPVLGVWARCKVLLGPLRVTKHFLNLLPLLSSPFSLSLMKHRWGQPLEPHLITSCGA